MFKFIERRKEFEEARRTAYNDHLFKTQMMVMSLTKRFNNNEDRKEEQMKKEPNSI